MSYEKGIPVTHVKEMYSQGINLKKLSHIISESFIHMIFEKGFVHSDPHPGNMFVRKKQMPDGTEDLELVILDHGIYTVLPEETRLSYTKLWRGILSQDEKMIKSASQELGADFYELFTAMIVNRTFDDIMDKEKTVKTKSRLGQISKQHEYPLTFPYRNYRREVVDQRLCSVLP